MKVFPLFLCLVSSVLFAQTDQVAINTQVWRPFIKHFNDNNTEGFLSVHSKDAVRSPRDAKQIWNRDEYFSEQAQGDDFDKKEKRKRTLELRFTERISQGSLAIEVGVYKTTYIFPDGKKRDYFGRFHVVLRKEEGIWKILVDTDSSEGGTFGESDFLKASPMEQP